LAKGLTNKEIADKLNISTNTVITHRKNLSQKTGIKSVSGLTIFAVVQKLVSIDDFNE
jgi:DNA-binding NarL/FixJ family response regulator